MEKRKVRRHRRRRASILINPTVIRRQAASHSSPEVSSLRVSSVRLPHAWKDEPHTLPARHTRSPRTCIWFPIIGAFIEFPFGDNVGMKGNGSSRSQLKCELLAHGTKETCHTNMSENHSARKMPTILQTPARPPWRSSSSGRSSTAGFGCPSFAALRRSTSSGNNAVSESKARAAPMERRVRLGLFRCRHGSPAGFFRVAQLLSFLPSPPTPARRLPFLFLHRAMSHAVDIESSSHRV